MKKIKRWLVPVLIAVVLVTAAATSRWWLPPLLVFVGANSDLIQGLTDLVQLVLWAGAGVAVLVGFLQGRRAGEPWGEHVDATESTVATHGGVAAGQIAVGGDVHGDIITVADPDLLWRAILRRPPAEDLRQATERYLACLVDRYRYLDFKGMGVSDRVPLRLPLVEMYVPLKARIEMPEGETWARELRLAGREVPGEEQSAIGERLSEPQPVLDLLRKNDGLIVLGDPGSGKTTFLKYLALRLAMGTDEGLGLKVRLPVLIPLSVYANALAERDVRLDDFVARYFHDLGADLPIGAMLEEALKQGGALVLLDGLDEVKDLGLRKTVADRVVDFYTFHRRAGNRFVLTSRIIGYQEVRPTAEGLAECTLVDFSDEKIEAFVGKWTAALERAARGDTQVAAWEAERERQELLEAVHRNPGVRGLAANPLLLTILALMKRQGVTLPERRVELYDQCVRTMLSSWNRARGLGRPPTRDLDVVEMVRVLAPLALWMHETSPGFGLVKQGDLRRKLAEIYQARGEQAPERAARQFIADVREHAGLLLERGAGRYGFIHLTFEEYLAAMGIARLGQRDIELIVDILADHVGDAAWREVALLTIGHLGVVQQWEEVSSDVVKALIEREPGEPGQAVALAGEAVVDAWPGGVTLECKRTVVQALVRTLRREDAKPTLRAAAGRALATLGDSRPGVGVNPDTDLPDIVWVEIPAGSFLMGTRPEDVPLLEERFGKYEWYSYEWETPRHEVTLPAYYIARYPVTNTQFWAFAEAGGYREQQYWGEAEVLGLWQDGKVKRAYPYDYDEEGKVKWAEEWGDAPVNYGEPFNLPNHPVVGVTWYEAVAFCRWVTEQFRVVGSEFRIWRDGELETLNLEPERLTVRLPSEAEWEKAARGTGGWRFPWGEEPDPNRANYDETGIGTTSAVGCFPGGASPTGVEDLSGNVWEWTRSLWGENWEEPDFGYPYDLGDGREDLEVGSEVRRVLRGGAFSYEQGFVRCAFRYGYYPLYRGRNYGFRVVVASPVHL